MRSLFALFMGAILILGGWSNADAQAKRNKLAVIMAAPIQDADYGTLAYETINFLKQKYDLQIAYAEKTQFPKPRGCTGNTSTKGTTSCGSTAPVDRAGVKIAGEYPNVVFIAEEDDVPKTVPPNFWIIERNYFLGFYPLGYLATLKTQSGKIGTSGDSTCPLPKAR